MRFLIALVIVLSSAVFAIDIDASIKKLGSDDYDERELATIELGTLPKEYATKLMLRSFSEPDYETSVRLYRASKLIFTSKIMKKEKAWLRLYGEYGFNFSVVNEYEIKMVHRPEPDDDNKTRRAYEVDARRFIYVDVTKAESDAEAKLLPGDIITSMNGAIIDSWKFEDEIIPDRGYKFEVMRPKRERKAEDRSCVTGLYPEDYEKIEITVIAAWKDWRDVNATKVSECEETLWAQFVNEVKLELPVLILPPPR